MSRDVVALICPNCGFRLGDQQLSRYYEQKVANWLNGKVCASLNPDFDVWRCSEFPKLTFQIKYAHIYHYTGKAKRHRSSAWPFNQATLNSDKPDYFILFGITDEKQEHCFLLTRKRFIAHSAKNGKGGRIMLMTPHQFSRRGGHRRSYIHENHVWKYEIKIPEENLVRRIQDYETFKQEQLF